MTWSVLMIGAGVRKTDDRCLDVDQRVNVVHGIAHGARIAFNTGLTDAAEAFQHGA